MKYASKGEKKKKIPRSPLRVSNHKKRNICLGSKAMVLRLLLIDPRKLSASLRERESYQRTMVRTIGAVNIE